MPTNSPSLQEDDSLAAGPSQTKDVLPKPGDTAGLAARPSQTTDVLPTPGDTAGLAAGPSQTKDVLPKPGDAARADAAEIHTTNVSSQEGSKAIDTQQQILDVLNRMYQEMQGQRGEEEGTRQSGRSASGKTSNGPFKKTRFGIPRQRFDQGQQLTTGNEDYEQIFAEDVYGDEAGPNARVFRVYNDEAAQRDNDMVGKSNDSSDVLLVFAGLFSAVLTTFVAQTSQALETDKITISNSLLLELVQLQRAQVGGTPLENVENAITETTPTSNDVWVNGLWFTSLTLSLATALFAVLTKQWLRQYMTSTSGTTRDRSLIRQFRFAGMRKWHVFGIIGLLPILLHLALSVFLAGLVVFLIPRCLPLAYVVGSITVIVYSLYFASNLIPIFDIQCPFRTPFSDILNIVHYQFRVTFSFTRRWTARLVNITSGYLHRALLRVPKGREITVVSLPIFEKLSGREHTHVREESINGGLSLDAIGWLMDTSSNPSVHSVALQGVGGLPPSQRVNVKDSIQPSPDLIERLINECLVWDGEKAICLPQSTRRLERIVRMCPIIFDRERFLAVRRKAYWRSLYTAFRELDDIRGMASALPMALHDPDAWLPALLISKQAGIDATEHLDLLTRLIRDSPRLAPKAWINLFLEVPSRSISKLDLFDICAKALEEISGWRDPTWDGVTSPDPVSASIALSRHPDVIISVFKNYDPFLKADDPPTSSLLPPDSLRLRALLTLHHFLEKSQTAAVQSSSGKERISLIRLFESTWKGISDVLEQDHAMNDCSAIFQAASLCIVASPLLTGHEWMASDELEKYSVVVLRSCRTACLYAGNTFGHHVVCEWGWKGLLDRVAKDLAFKSGDISSFPMYSLRLWRAAMDYSVQDGYSIFVEANSLTHSSDTYSTQSLVKSFILGLDRQRHSDAWSLRQSPEPKWLLDCLNYLHHPDNLLSACRALVKHNDTTAEEFLVLVRLQPDNDNWISCQRSLREWAGSGPFLPSEHERLKKALDALDKFFESRRRHKEFLHLLNPATLFRCTPKDIEADVESSGDHHLSLTVHQGTHIT